MTTLAVCLTACMYRVLKKQGRHHNSDQGFYLGEHGWFDKRWMYEESLLTLLIVRWPVVTKAQSVNEHVVSPLDFSETFADIAG